MKSNMFFDFCNYIDDYFRGFMNASLCIDGDGMDNDFIKNLVPINLCLIESTNRRCLSCWKVQESILEDICLSIIVI
jgi:hypothetical protein